MFDFLIVVKDNAIAITTLVGVFTIIGGFIGAHIKNKREKEKYELEKQKIESDKKSIRQQMITNNIAPMRQEWINDIRSKATKFLSLIDYMALYQNSHDSDDEEWKLRMKKIFDDNALLVDELYLYLLVALPFSREEKKEEIAESIRKKITGLYKRLQYDKTLPDEDYEKILTDIHSCLEDVKLLLKKEWEETKSLKEIDTENGI
ncbi:TPA: hypothetical protein ACKRW7_000132 [Providencia rettgeri]